MIVKQVRSQSQCRPGRSIVRMELNNVSIDNPLLILINVVLVGRLFFFSFSQTDRNQTPTKSNGAIRQKTAGFNLYDRIRWNQKPKTKKEMERTNHELVDLITCNTGTYTTCRHYHLYIGTDNAAAHDARDC